MSGALSVADLVATVGAKINEGEWAHVESFLKLAAHGVEKLWGAVEGTVDRALEAVRQTAERGDEVGMLAAQFGVAADALQEFQYAAVLSDASAEGLNTGFARLARTASDAASGSTEAAAALAGLRLRDVAGNLRPVDELFGDLADKVAALPSATERLALAQKVLGRGARELVPMLAGGRKAIERLREEARESGAVLSAAAIESGEAWDDSAKRLQAHLTGLRNLFAAPAAVDALAEIQDALTRLAKTAAVRSVFEALGETFASVLKLVAQLTNAVAEWFESDPDRGLNLLTTAAIALGVSLGYLATSALPGLVAALAPLLAPVGAVSAALAALYLVVDDFAVFRRGGKSILGDIVAWLNEPIPENEGGLLGTLRAIVGTIAEMLRLLDEAKRHFTGEATKGKVGDVLPGETPEAAAARLGGTYRRPEQGERYLPWFESAKSAMGLDAIPQPARSGGETGAGPGPQPAARGDTRTTATMPVSVTVNVGSGADAGEVGDAVAKAFEGLWDSKIRTEFVTLTGGTP